MAADAQERMMVLLRAPVTGTPVMDLMPRAFEISVTQAVTHYDSLYVARAKKFDVPLLTADERLIRRIASDAVLAKRMIWIGHLSA
jgi:predicted nucleic acid-binding protein